MIVLFEIDTKTKTKNIAYQSYLSSHYLSSEKKHSLMLKPCENKQSLMSLLQAAGFYPQHAKSKYCIIFQGTNLLLRS